MSPPAPDQQAAVRIARAFHQVYEELAPAFGYRTREESAVDFALIPENNRNLMVATVKTLLEQGTITEGAQ